MFDHTPESAFQNHPKLMFYLGLFIGVSSVTTLVLALMVGWLLSGKGILSLNAGINNQAAAEVQAAPTVDDTAPVAGPVPAVDPSTDHIKGAVNAKVTLIEYSDFECPYCTKHRSSLDQAVAEFPNDVQLVYRHFPLSFHANAQKAAEASECAAKQGKFWEMHDKIFEASGAGTMSVDKWKELARGLGLDGAKFDACLDSGETADRVAQNLDEGSYAGVGGTPATFVNGQLVEGAVPYETLKAMIQAELQ
jgi:protein-disulfide isomerase